MPFSQPTKQEALVRSRRRCCLCQKFAGRNIEVHHMIQEADGGPDTLDNAIALCFDCHADVGHYNSQHPRGNKYSPEELRLHRDNWWQWCSEHPFDPLPDDPISVSPSTVRLRSGKWKDISRFKIHNKTEEIYYQIWVKLILNIPPFDWTDIVLKPTETKAEMSVSVGNYDVTDDCLLFCGLDENHNKAILMRIAELEPHETRTFKITNNSQRQSLSATREQAMVYIMGTSSEPAQIVEHTEESSVAVSFTLPETFTVERQIHVPMRKARS